jgi:hypothetical protein
MNNGTGGLIGKHAIGGRREENEGEEKTRKKKRRGISRGEEDKERMKGRRE